MTINFDTNKSIIDVFDYVIVGAGPSAMGILRGILENILDANSPNDPLPSTSIAIVERGHGPPHDIVTNCPKEWFEAATSSSASVKLYPSEIMGRTMEIPVGEGLGGTSNVNACICHPPLQRDLESWPEPHRSSLIPISKYLKRVMADNKCIQQTSLGNIHNPFSLQKSVLDFRNPVETMATRDRRTDKAVRKNYYDALVDPLLKEQPFLEKYLHWFRGYEAQRLLLGNDGSRVVGIECISTSDDHISVYREIHANKRVILCAGALETPALLLVSKLGDKEPLWGVGQHLMDQALLARVYMRPPSIRDEAKSANGIAALGHLKIKTDNCKCRCQIFQVAVCDSVAVSIISSLLPTVLRWRYQSKIITEALELFFRCAKAAIYFAIQYTPLGFILQRLTTTTMVFLMHPSSRGSVTISPKRGSRPGPRRRRDFVIHADPKYLDDPQDMNDLKNAWDATKKLSPSSFEVFPSPMFSIFKLFRSGKFWFETYCRCYLLPYYHFSGSCTMIRDNEKKNKGNWVVDSSLKVRGHDGLYICDASVFPTMPSNPPALTCAALGYEFAVLALRSETFPKIAPTNTYHEKIEVSPTKRVK